MTSTKRFSDRSELYAKFRPGYPLGVLGVLKAETGLCAKSIVADVGSGTGISSRFFAPHVELVYAIEPNAEMRAVAEREEPVNVISVDGTAEATGLVSKAVDLVIAANAFHWFNSNAARTEFRRILKPVTGVVVLMWNMRAKDSSPLVAEYEQLLKDFGTDYSPTLMSDNWRGPAADFFGAGKHERRALPNHQEFDLERFRGRLLSASYAPLPGAEKHEPMMARLGEIFEKYQVDGQVRFDYETQVYWGKV